METLETKGIKSEVIKRVRGTGTFTYAAMKKIFVALKQVWGVGHVVVSTHRVWVLLCMVICF
jgi:hypothetical protein